MNENQQFSCVWDALEDMPQEAASMRARSALMMGLTELIRQQGMTQAQHVHQVPAAALVLPLARVGIDQVAPEQEARDLVVEADAVVAHAHRARPREFGFDALRNAGAVQPVAPEKWGEQFMALEHPDLYHDQFGLHWDNPAFIRSERLNW